MLDVIGNGRPAGDLLSRSVRVKLGSGAASGGQEYVLPVRTIKGNRDWKAQLDSRLTSLLEGLETGGDNLPAIWALLERQVDDLLDLLVSYDTTGVLPSRDEIEETTYEDELLAAVREVWRAANPLAVTGGLAALMIPDLLENGSSAPTSSPPPNGAGRRKRSKKG